MTAAKIRKSFCQWVKRRESLPFGTARRRTSGTTPPPRRVWRPGDRRRALTYRCPPLPRTISPSPSRRTRSLLRVPLKRQRGLPPDEDGRLKVEHCIAVNVVAHAIAVLL